MKYKYILFDLDGTVTDPKIGITKSVKYALEKYNISVNSLDELDKFIGPPLKNSFMEYYSFDEKKALKSIEFYREYYKEKGIFENYLYNDIENLLKKLKDNNCIIAIATSKPTIFAKKIIEYFNLTKYFDYIIGSNLDNTRSNKDEVIEYTMKKIGITDYSNAIMIGDRKHDIIGAIKNNMDSIGILYGYGSLEELKEANATFIAKDIQELSNILFNTKN